MPKKPDTMKQLAKAIQAIAPDWNLVVIGPCRIEQDTLDCRFRFVVEFLGGKKGEAKKHSVSKKRT